MDDITFPKAVENFIAATNAHDANALARSSRTGPTVRDDGKTWTGGARDPRVDPGASDHPKNRAHADLVRGRPAGGRRDGDFPGGPLSSRSCSASRTTRSPTT
jgi:hypothetical protein